MAAWQNRNVPVRFTRRICFQPSSVISWLCSKRRMPAPFTSRSSRPPRSSAAATATGAVAGSPTSPARVATRSGSADSVARLLEPLGRQVDAEHRGALLDEPVDGGPPDP